MSARDLFDLRGRTALVTGAGRGIGRAIARGIGEMGATVVVAEIDVASGRDAEANLRDAGIEARFVRTDVTDPTSVEAAFDFAGERFGGADIVVNNAGMSQRTPAEAYPDADLDRMIRLNVHGVFHGMRAAARRWIEAGRGGTIINLASFAGLVADPLSAPYAASKGAVVQLTRTCAVEWAPHRIRVNAIAPGYTRTAMTAPALGDPTTRAAAIAKTPLGRVAEPEDLVGAAIFLASAASDYVTGHILAVDGGWTAA
jgi:NAD(P)-dependent dehydrogenase (short-subunit alcohol dehydrogenase family)